MSDDVRNTILAAIDHAVSDLLYYDRKNDEDLPKGAIDDAVRDGTVTVEEMVAKFETCLRDGLR